MPQGVGMFSRIMESLRTRLANAWTALVGPQENIHDWIKRQPPKTQEPLPTGGLSIPTPISPCLREKNPDLSYSMSMLEMTGLPRLPVWSEDFPSYLQQLRSLVEGASTSTSPTPDGLKSVIELVSGPALISKRTEGSLQPHHLGICQDLPMNGEKPITPTECSQPLSQDGFSAQSKPERTSELSEKQRD